MISEKEQLLNFVEQSPRAVAAQDRRAWLALFSERAVIEDPVGSHPHQAGLYDGHSGSRGNGPVQRFYDTFIRDNTVLFHTDKDFVCNGYVMRDLELEPGGLGARVPMHLVYEVIEERGELKVQRLAAHWNPRNTKPVSEGAPAAGQNKQGSGTFSKMFKVQGLLGTLRWMKCLGSVGPRGIAVAGKCLDLLASLTDLSPDLAASMLVQQGKCDVVKDRLGLLRLQTENLFVSSEACIEFPAGSTAVTCCDLALRQLTFEASKWITAGSAVSCSLQIRDKEGREFDGVAVFELNRRNYKIENIRFFFDS